MRICIASVQWLRLVCVQSTFALLHYLLNDLIAHHLSLTTYRLLLAAYCLLLTAASCLPLKNRTGHFSRNSLPETIKLKNTRLVVSSFTVFGRNQALLLLEASDLFLFWWISLILYIQRFVSAFFGSDAVRFVNRRHEDFSITNFTGVSLFQKTIDCLL